MAYVSGACSPLPSSEEDGRARKKARHSRLGVCIKPEKTGAGGDPTGNYWAGEGALQALYDKIYEEHVPANGAPTTGGEAAQLVYALSKVLHEWFNSGFMNGVEDFKGVKKASDVKRTTLEWGFQNMLGYLSSVSESADDLICHYIGVAPKDGAAPEFVDSEAEEDHESEVESAEDDESEVETAEEGGGESEGGA